MTNMYDLFFSNLLKVLIISETKINDIYCEVNKLFKNITYKSKEEISEINRLDFDLIIVNDNNINFIEYLVNDNLEKSILVFNDFKDSNFSIELLKLKISGFLLFPIDKNQFNNQLEKTINDIKQKNLEQDSINKYDLLLSKTKEYELAINESNILSRSDLKGNITFANEKFYEISGYSESELIGKNHNIVRHPDTSSEVFKNLWKTIKKGEVWNGTIKNKNKNGNSYWVNTTIIPVKDMYNNIVEYLSIRHDLSELFHLHGEIEETQREIIYRMGEVGETRSKETGQHVKRVAQYSKDLALLCGLSREETHILFSASPMHDIGKVGIPDEILKKSGKLTIEEFELMKSHTTIGHNILKGSSRDILKAASIISLTHHEKWDGSGYPKGLRGTKIHIFGRITAIADVFDALGSDRVYKKAWPDEEIFEYILKERGKSFDPTLVDIFMKNIDVFLNTREKYKDII